MKMRAAKKVIKRAARSERWDGGYPADTMKRALRVLGRYYKRGLRAMGHARFENVHGLGYGSFLHVESKP